MDLKRIIGQCAPLFYLAVTFDLVGFVLLLVGLCASPQLGGRCYGDFLALTGAVLMFFGLGMWVLWYAGNIGADEKGSGFRRISRKLTERLNSMRDRAKDQRDEEDGGKSEKNEAYINKAYEPEDNEAF